MIGSHPFSRQEKEVMDLLIQAHNKYIELLPVSLSENEDWSRAFHLLQDVLIVRTVIRNYPTYFNTKQQP